MTRTNFSLGIKRLPYSRMLKSEMADYVEKTIAIVENHDLESELITPMYELLSAKEPDIRLLRLSYGIDTERLRVSKLKGKMMLIISAFKLKVRLLSKSNPELDMHVVQNAINQHLRHLGKCKNDKQLSQKIAGFFDMVQADDDLQTALTDFNLNDEVDNMESIYLQVEKAWQKRVRLLSLRPTVSTRVIVKGMVEAVNNLFKGVEVANLISTVSEGGEPGDTIDYVPLIDELNQLSEMYSLSISIRDANNKRKNKEGDETDGEGGDEPIEEPEEPTNGTTTNMQTTAMNDNDNETGNGYDPFDGRISPFRTMDTPSDEADTIE